jgi:hypothetical protein
VHERSPETADQLTTIGRCRFPLQGDCCGFEQGLNKKSDADLEKFKAAIGGDVQLERDRKAAEWPWMGGMVPKSRKYLLHNMPAR